MKMRVVMFAGALLLFALPGCLYMREHPLGIEPIARESGSLRYEVIGEAQGESAGLTLFGIASVTPLPTYDEAVSAAIRSKGGDNMIEVMMWYERKVYIIGVVDIIRVKGKVIRYIRDTM